MEEMIDDRAPARGLLALGPRPLGWRYDAKGSPELLRVADHPDAPDPLVLDEEDGHRVIADAPPGRRNPEKLPSVRAAARQPGNDSIVGDDELVYAVVPVRKRCAHGFGIAAEGPRAHHGGA